MKLFFKIINMKIIKKFFKHLLIILLIGGPIIILLKTLHILNPIDRALSDFKFSDIYFGHFQKKATVLDDNIYFVDIGVQDKSITRSKITRFINNINQNYKPKVIALDVLFHHDSDIPDIINEELVKALDKDNILMSYSLKEKVQDYWLKDGSELPVKGNLSSGYNNNLIGKKVEYGVERFFQPFILEKDDTLKHFSILASEKAQLNIDKSLFKNDNKVMINYKYRYSEPILIDDTSNYFKLKDKIIIIGLFTKNKEGLPLYNEDLHYTPSNKFYFGKSPPNMYGGEILATIISNIKDNSFIEYYKNTSFWVNIILSVLIYLTLLFFMGLSHNIFIAVTIITQFFLVVFFVLASIFFLVQFNLYFDLTIVGVIAFFSVEFVGVIEEILHLLEGKFKNSKS